jgi:hypothetical protein
MFGLFKKKKDTLIKFEMLGFTETALNSFDNFLVNELSLKNSGLASINILMKLLKFSMNFRALVLEISITKSNDFAQLIE